MCVPVVERKAVLDPPIEPRVAGTPQGAETRGLRSILPFVNSIVSCAPPPIIAPGEQLMPSRRFLVLAIAPIVAAVIAMACSADSSSAATTLNSAASPGPVRLPPALRP